MAIFLVYPPAGSGGGGGGGSNASVGSNGITAPLSSTQIAGVNPSGNLQPVAVSASGAVTTTGASDVQGTGGTITVVDTGTTSTAGANGQNQITGTPTAGSAVTFPLSSVETGTLELSNTWVATVVVEVSVDNGVTYVSTSLHQIGSSIFSSTYSANVIGSINLAGKTHMRVRATAFTSGTITVALRESLNASTLYVANPLRITDGAFPLVATPLTIKPASTAPLATDASVVTTMSPNSPASTSALQTAGNSSLATIATNTSGVTVGQGSTTTSQTGQLIQGAAATTAPSYTTGTTNPLSLNLSGGLRVDPSGVTSPVTYPDITTSGTISTQNLNPSSGTATAGSTVGLTLNGQGTVTFSVVGTYTGALTPQVSMDGSNWTSAAGLFRQSNAAYTGTVISAVQDVFSADVTGFNMFRVSANAATTGSATITMRASQASLIAVVANTITVGANTLATALYEKITDGTNTSAVKAASTAAATTDPALVVSLSPNSPAIVQTTKGTLTDGSGTTSATPSTATTLMAVNASRKYLFIQNNSTVNTLWINFTTTAVTSQPSIQLLPGASLVQEASYVSTELVSVICSVASSPYTAKQG